MPWKGRTVKSSSESPLDMRRSRSPSSSMSTIWMPGRAPDRHHRAEDRLRPEALPGPAVDERHHVLELLRDEGDEVRLAVLVEVRDRHVDPAGPRVDRVALELRLLPVRGHVLVDEDAAHGVPAEGGRHEVEVAVAVEVGGLDVGGARDLLHEDDLLELERSGLAQPHDAALLVVARHEVAEVGDRAGPASRPCRGPPSRRGRGWGSGRSRAPRPAS